MSEMKIGHNQKWNNVLEWVMFLHKFFSIFYVYYEWCINNKIIIEMGERRYLRFHKLINMNKYLEEKRL